MLPGFFFTQRRKEKIPIIQKKKEKKEQELKQPVSCTPVLQREESKTRRIYMHLNSVANKDLRLEGNTVNPQNISGQDRDSPKIDLQIIPVGPALATNLSLPSYVAASPTVHHNQQPRVTLSCGRGRMKGDAGAERERKGLSINRERRRERERGGSLRPQPLALSADHIRILRIGSALFSEQRPTLLSSLLLSSKVCFFFGVGGTLIHSHKVLGELLVSFIE